MIVSDHNNSCWALMCLGTVMYGLNDVGTIMSGHNNSCWDKCVWAQSCMGLIRWAQSCLGTNVSGHKRVWAQTCVGTNVCGHKGVWAQMCVGTVVWSQTWLNHNGAVLYQNGLLILEFKWRTPFRADSKMRRNIIYIYIKF